MPILVLAELGAVAEASDAEVKVTADGAAYPDRIGDVLAAWVAMVFNARLRYILLGLVRCPFAVSDGHCDGGGEYSGAAVDAGWLLAWIEGQPWWWIAMRS